MMDSYGTILSGLLSPDSLRRRGAEEQLESWKITQDYGLTLAQVIIGVGAERPLEHRHLCCTLLKQYVESHWSPNSEKFSPPEPSDEVKAKIRKLLPFSLKDTQNCVRVGGAYAIAAIARYDWPEAWPNLFDLVGAAMKSNNADLVDGAICLCSELVNIVTEQQMKNMEHLMLSELLNIFVHGETYTTEMRSRAASIFSSITSLVYKMNKSDSNAGHRVAYYYFLQRFAEAFCNVLSVPDDAACAIGLKTEVVKALALIVEKFPRQFQTWVPRVVPAVGAILQQSSQIYIRFVVEGEMDDEQSVDTDALDQLIYALIEFLQSVVNERKYAHFVVDDLPQLMYLLLQHIQIPQEKVEEWSKDVQRYVEEEDVDMCINSVRLSALDLLVNLCDSFPVETVSALCSAVVHQMEESKRCKESGNSSWWKIREACYTSMGILAPTLLQILQEKKTSISFNLIEFASTMLTPDMTNPGPVFLQGHAISLCGRIANALGPFVLKPLLDLCSAALLPRHDTIVRICACRAFYNFCYEAKQRGADVEKLCDMKSVVSSLVTLGVRSGEAVLNLVLTTLLSVVQANPEAVTVDSKVVPLCTAALLKYSGDPVIPSQVADIVRVLMAVPSCREQMERSMFPTICSIVGREDRSKLPIRLPAVCLEVLESIVRGSPLPLTDSVVVNGFPAAVRCLLTSDDCHVLAAGRECIRAYVSKAANQVLSWNDGINSGVSLIVKIICHLLSPTSPELSASMVGRLIFVLLKHANNETSPYLEEVLRAVLCKLYSSELNCIHQSLIMVFAHLIHYQLEPVLQFLSSVPAPNDSNALHYVLSLWCEKQILFFGSYDQKLSTLALCKLFVHAVSTPDSSLRDMTVIEDVGHKATSGKDVPQPRTIPLLVKIFKLVIHELAGQLELRVKPTSVLAAAIGDNLGGSEDENVAAGKQGCLAQEKVVEALREIVAEMQGDVNDDISDENDDPDLADDAMSGMDLGKELTNFLTQLSQQQYYQELCEGLTEPERAILRKVNLI